MRISGMCNRVFNSMWHLETERKMAKEPGPSQPDYLSSAGEQQDYFPPIASASNFAQAFAASLDDWQDEVSFVEEKPELPLPAKRRRNSVMTLDMKMKIIEEVEGGRNRQLIMKEYSLPSSTLSEILKRKDEIRFAVSSSVFTPQRKRMRAAKYNDLEEEVWEWYTDMTKKGGVTITGPEICQKAKEVAAKMKIEEFTANNGWLCRFKQRRGIQVTFRPRTKTANGEDSESNSSSKPAQANQVKLQSTHTWSSKIVPGIMKRYHPRDIFTAGETSLFYRCTPDTMVRFLGEDCSCGKFAKDRLTVMVATNMLGTEKLPAFAIGKYKQPRCFKNIKTIPVEYMANLKAWMIAPFFKLWLKKLDSKMVSEGRNIVLFVSPSEGHPRVTDLQAVSMIFLPPDTHYQPAHQGILQTLKQNYRRSIIQRRLHFAEVNGPNEECSINLIDALHWLRSAWKDVTPRCIYNSFGNAEFSLPNYESLVPGRHEEQSQNRDSYSSDTFQLECDVMMGNSGQILMDAEYGRMFERLAKEMVLDPYITAESYASLDDKVVTSGHMTDQELEEAMAKTLADEQDDEEEEIPLPPPTFIEAKQCLTKLARFFATERGTEQFFDKIACLYKHVAQASTNTPQSTIIDLFSKKAKKPPKKKKTLLVEMD
ncbi:tigger transposable element-derived protein 4 [Plakobranchus ocellatus]|uniref:Tigger transposable element-derived protein 4 n=1 Tax=Plakobranchus ocellatus TaxID=259542 RepID=A0AAV4AIM7_9GAST|nr:tigger transposable element-derived protein 4 [Plakobranchus ocellatus]